MTRFSLPRNLQLLAKHRQFLYGFSALWILFFHWTLTVPRQGLLIPVHHFQKIGACGVEVFLLLTGFGLYHSLNRNPSVGRFYKNRLLRVFLPSVLVMGVFNLGKYDSLLSYLASSTFLGYWFGAKTLWYIAFILTMYLLYPLIFRLQKKQPALPLVPALLAFGVSLLLETISQDAYREVLRGISRIPVFLLGCYLAPFVHEGKEIPKAFPAVNLLAIGPLTFLWKVMNARGYSYSFRFLTYGAYALLAIYLVCLAAEFCSRRGTFRGLYRWFSFCGGISLEIYLLFERFLDVLAKCAFFQQPGSGLWLLNLAATLCTFVFAVLLQRLTAWIAGKIT